MENKLEHLKKVIEKNGYQFTRQRKLVLTILLKSSIHLNAEEIFDQLKTHNIGIATIYRSLNQLSELGITKEININGISYYEMKIFGKKPLHIHFKCVSCNDIIDIDNNDWNLEYIELNHKIEEETNLDIYDIDIILKGLCNKCKKTNKESLLYVSQST